MNTHLTLHWRPSTRNAPPASGRWAAWLLGLGMLLGGCSSIAPAPPAAPTARAPAPAPAPAAPPDAPWPGAIGEVAGSGERVLVYVPRAGDSFAGIAARFLGQASEAWQVAEANESSAAPAPGQPLIVPLVPRNPLGISAAGIQTVTVLCYHRLGPGQSKMVVSPERFEEQMNHLAANGYRVVRLSDLQAFMDGERALPARSVVITFDDGYESMYRHAFPVLQRLGFPATMFVYSDFIGARDALTWPQMEEMVRSGLVDLQAHSKTHRNLAERQPGESDEAYRRALDQELQAPRKVLEDRLAALGVRVRQFAYPFGSANAAVLDAMLRAEYEMGLTVTPGSNAFFAPALMLRRTMIFGDHSLADFTTRLQVQRPLPRP